MRGEGLARRKSTGKHGCIARTARQRCENFAKAHEFLRQDMQLNGISVSITHGREYKFSRTG